MPLGIALSLSRAGDTVLLGYAAGQLDLNKILVKVRSGETSFKRIRGLEFGAAELLLRRAVRHGLCGSFGHGLLAVEHRTKPKGPGAAAPGPSTGGEVPVDCGHRIILCHSISSRWLEGQRCILENNKKIPHHIPETD